MTVIYQVETKMQNPHREHRDLYSDLDDAMSYYNGVKRNPDCLSIDVIKFADSEDFSLLKSQGAVASYYRNIDKDLEWKNN